MSVILLLVVGGLFRLVAADSALGSATRARVSEVLDESRASLLNSALDNDTSAAQALAVNNLLGVNTIAGWPTGHMFEMGAANGMCRVKDRRSLDLPFDHGLHCNVAYEWYFAVGTLDAGDTIIGYEVMFLMEKLTPSSKCTCDFDGTHKPNASMRLTDPSGRIAETQFAVVVAPKAGIANSSAVSPSASHFQAEPTVRMWTGLADDEAVSAAWGFRIGNVEITSESTDLKQLRVIGRDDQAGIAVNLTLERSQVPMLQGGDGYIGEPLDGNGEFYYSLVGMRTAGSVVASGREYNISGGFSWLDHQLGTIGVPARKDQAAAAFAAYTAGVNINPVNMGFGIPGTENWFGLHLLDSAHKYTGAFCAVLVSYKTWEKRDDDQNQTVGEGQFLSPEGVQQRVNYSYSILDYFVASDGSKHGKTFRFDLVSGNEVPGLPAQFVAESLASDSRCRWGSGGEYYEGAVEVRSIDGNVIGHGYTEGVGWDRRQISRTVQTALRRVPTGEEVDLLSSRPPKASPPPQLTSHVSII